MAEQACAICYALMFGNAKAIAETLANIMEWHALPDVESKAWACKVHEPELAAALLRSEAA